MLKRLKTNRMKTKCPFCKGSFIMASGKPKPFISHYIVCSNCGKEPVGIIIKDTSDHDFDLRKVCSKLDFAKRHKMNPSDVTFRLHRTKIRGVVIGTKMMIYDEFSKIKTV